MTSEEIIDFFAPAQSSVDAVINWLVSAGIERQRISQSANKQASISYKPGYYRGVFCLSLARKSDITIHIFVQFSLTTMSIVDSI